MKDLHEIAANARKAFYQISVSTADQRNKVLLSLARADYMHLPIFRIRSIKRLYPLR